MDWKNQLTKTPYLVLFIVLITIGVGTASALITITLDGDVIITGDTELQGDLTCTNCIDSTDIGDNEVTPSELSRFGLGTFSLIEGSTVGSEPCILGEVRLFAGNLVPKGWLPAEGQTLEISQNQELFSLMGTTYGGDGQNDFQIPDLSEINPKSSPFNVGLNYAICTEGVFPGMEDMIIPGELLVEGQATVVGDFQVQGQAEVSGGPIISTRSTSDGNTSNLVIQRTEGATAETTSFALSHRTSDQDLWLYGFDGSTFKNFVGFDYPNYKINFPATSNTLVVDAANDLVGIGTNSPSSELDVVGNVTISGDLVVGGIPTLPTIYSKNITINIEPGVTAGVAVNCDVGDIAFNGGFLGLSNGDYFIKDSHRNLSSEEHWGTKVQNDHTSTISGTWFAYCFDVSYPIHEP